jgi:phospholipid/cholesterol/gamma-HCH transport system ATP-binding protein
MAKDDNIVSIENLHFYRGRHKVFNGVDLQVPRGKIVTVMGPSGSGKTTLLKLIGAQLRPQAGKISFAGKDIHALPRTALYEMRKKMGMLFQSGALFSNLSVFDNVAFPIVEHTTLDPDMLRMLVLMKLEAVGLRGARDLMPSELSGGMTRRVAFARAIALDPEVIMYDEPFTGLDPISMGILLKLIKNLNETLGLTSILVSHDVGEAASISDYIYLISGGKIIGQGTPDELKLSSSDQVRQFMDGLPDGPVPFHYPCSNDYVDDLFQWTKK